MARPKKDISAVQVSKLARIGCTDVEIAWVCDCSVDTINRRFAENLTKGRADLHKRLRMKQIRRAMGGSDRMLIWLGKQYLDQTEKQDHTIHGTLGNYSLQDLTLDQLVRLERGEDPAAVLARDK